MPAPQRAAARDEAVFVGLQVGAELGAPDAAPAPPVTCVSSRSVRARLRLRARGGPQPPGIRPDGRGPQAVSGDRTEGVGAWGKSWVLLLRSARPFANV